MSAQAPQVLSRRTNGVLPAGANQTNESPKARIAADSGATRPGRGKCSNDKGTDAKSSANDADNTPKSSRTKTPSEGEKVVIRRLPPGMTLSEFSSSLGLEWEVGKGRVDWFYYAAGKISNDPAKPSRPGRAYLHLLRKDDVLLLSEAVRAATWEDAKNTFNSTSLVGPPSLEFAAYKKVPASKKRADARQGTIDQDPEFMAFLEGLANPTPLRESIDQEEGEEASKNEITTTPLIEFLKEKRANKLKEAAAAKSAKHARQETAGKGKAAAKDDDGSKKKGRESKSAKADKAPSRETVNILTKKVAVEQAAEAAKTAANQIGNASAASAAAAAAEAQPKSRRAGIAQAARILQRDLGLSPGSAHRRARQDAAKAEADSKGTVNTSANASAAANGKDMGKDIAPTGGESQPPTAARAESANPPSVKAQQPSSGRRGRGSGKNSDKGKNHDLASSEKLAAAPPMILKKKAAGDASETPWTTAGNASASQSAFAPAPGPAKPASSTSPAGASRSGPGKSSAATPAKTTAAVTANAVRAFVKHVNASQGITEAALRQALEVFGPITNVETDKRKGFAYVDFADHAGLVRAVAAGPVSVAQGNVQVLERKDKKPAAGDSAPAEKSTSRGRRGRGGVKSHAAASGSQGAANDAG